MYRCLTLLYLVSLSACAMAPVLGEDAQALPRGEFSSSMSMGWSTRPSLVQKDRSALDQQRSTDMQTDPERIEYAPPGENGTPKYTITDGSPADHALLLRWRGKVGVGWGVELFADLDLFLPIYGAGAGVRWQMVDTRFVRVAWAISAMYGGFTYAAYLGSEEEEPEGPDAEHTLWSQSGRVIVTGVLNRHLRISLAPTLTHTSLTSRSVADYNRFADGQANSAVNEPTGYKSTLDLGFVERSSYAYGGVIAVHFARDWDAVSSLGVELGTMYTPSAYGLPAFWSFQPALTGTFSTF